MGAMKPMPLVCSAKIGRRAYIQLFPQWPVHNDCSPLSYFVISDPSAALIGRGIMASLIGPVSIVTACT